MWKPPYHRDLMPEGIDNSTFGEICKTSFMTLSESNFAASRTIEKASTLTFSDVKSFLVDPTEIDLPKYLKRDVVNTSLAYSEPIQVELFLPDHAVYATAKSGNFLIEETLDHSNLFFSKYFCVDRTTGWKWRCDQDWQVNTVLDGMIGYCYHRYEYQYFHWITDSIARIWALKKKSPYTDLNKWMLGPLNQRFHAPSIALFDISVEDCIWPVEPGVVRLESAIVPTFRLEEANKVRRPDFRSGTFHTGSSREFVRDMQELGVRKYGDASIRPNLKIFIGRSDAAHRNLINEGEIFALAEVLGFVYVIPGKLAFQDQVKTFSEATHIISVHGAGLTNLIWANQDCRILEILPDGLGDTGYRFLSGFGEKYYSVMTCIVSEHLRGIAYANLYADPNIFCRAMEELIS